jgi:hypothetical protein
MPRNYIASSQIFAAIICSNTTTVFPLELLKRLQTSLKKFAETAKTFTKCQYRIRILQLFTVMASDSTETVKTFTNIS